jgi:hypothetical protein
LKGIKVGYKLGAKGIKVNIAYQLFEVGIFLADN